MPYTTRTAPNIQVYSDKVTNRISLCSECRDVILAAGPGTVYRHTDLRQPTGETPLWECEHCGRLEEDPADYAEPFQDPEETR